jgi:hypothetical protein
MRCTGNHPYPRKDSLHLPPFDRKRKHSPQDLKLAVHGGDLHTGILPAPRVACNFLAVDRVERLVRDGGILQ